jgi:hypothetical protein
MTPLQRENRLTRWRRTLLVIAILAIAMAALATWYMAYYSMDVAHTSEVEGSPSGPRVLIATQGSAFKDAVTTGLVERLKKRSAHIKVIDIAALSGVRESDWDAMVVIHTWEFRKPPTEVRVFVDHLQDRNKLVALATSGAGTFRMEGIDAISSASTMVDAPIKVNDLANRVDAVLNRAAEGRAQ